MYRVNAVRDMWFAGIKTHVPKQQDAKSNSRSATAVSHFVHYMPLCVRQGSSNEDALT